MDEKNTKKKVSERMLGNKYNQGKKLSKIWRRNISKSLIGNDFAKGNVMTIESRKKISKSLTGKKFTRKHRQKLREAAVLYLRGVKTCGPRYNKEACKFFNELNKIKKWNGVHAENGGEYSVSGYFVDFYDKKRNIVVEYDEPHHYKFGKLLKKDKERQKEIIKYLKCKFYRYNSKTKKLKRYYA